MAEGHDATGRRASDEEDRPAPELRWVQVREPRRALEIGRNGRIVASEYHEEYDAWEVLLETYDEYERGGDEG
ncbi:hypothetical protein M0R89_01310 [Halorussus limi]|uniref:Uncharacterized protein n=1 Tax=Halorussus limi TaxID=2938695 RepID=A0A8U0HVG8_9EURY|nr:hypothetical protein [Halorussus limi]UPV74723.1 hypothetical protein M0R89_01310 [Halorussus limi]